MIEYPECLLRPPLSFHCSFQRGGGDESFPGDIIEYISIKCVNLALTGSIRLINHRLNDSPPCVNKPEEEKRKRNRLILYFDDNFICETLKKHNGNILLCVPLTLNWTIITPSNYPSMAHQEHRITEWTLNLGFSWEITVTRQYHSQVQKLPLSLSLAGPPFTTFLQWRAHSANGYCPRHKPTNQPARPSSTLLSSSPCPVITVRAEGRDCDITEMAHKK